MMELTGYVKLLLHIEKDEDWEYTTDFKNMENIDDVDNFSLEIEVVVRISLVWLEWRLWR